MKLARTIAAAAWLAAAMAANSAPPPEEPVVLEADSAEIDDKKGVSVYTGNVKLTRGALTMTADKLTVYRQKQELQKVVAVGAPVHLHRAASATTKEARGEGQRAEYDPNSGDVLLLENAVLFQDRNEFRGNEIRYNLNSEFVNATKGASSDQRVRVVIHPKNSDGPPAP
jgi:lipopolysaccharide export system protein LptA